MGHFYDRDGNPQHFTNGRDSTLRDARKHGWFPSVTGILDTLDKPGLNNWKLKRVSTAAWDNPPVGFDTPESYHDLLMQEAFKESEGQRDRGSEIHAAMEDIWNGDKVRGDGDIIEIADAACSAIRAYCETGDFTPEITFAHRVGFGGMVDLHSDEFCIDYKSKDITDQQWDKYTAGKKPYPALAYPEHAMQLAAYDQGLENPGRRCINVFVDRQIPGRVVIHEWDVSDMDTAWEKFRLLVRYWQLAKNYFPGRV